MSFWNYNIGFGQQQRKKTTTTATTTTKKNNNNSNNNNEKQQKNNNNNTAILDVQFYKVTSSLILLLTLDIAPPSDAWRKQVENIR